MACGRGAVCASSYRAEVNSTVTGWVSDRVTVGLMETYLGGRDQPAGSKSARSMTLLYRNVVLPLVTAGAHVLGSAFFSAMSGTNSRGKFLTDRNADNRRQCTHQLVEI